VYGNRVWAIGNFVHSVEGIVCGHPKGIEILERYGREKKSPGPNMIHCSVFFHYPDSHIFVKLNYVLIKSRKHSNSKAICYYPCLFFTNGRYT
jgi:hypothetical protein